MNDKKINNPVKIDRPFTVHTMIIMCALYTSDIITTGSLTFVFIMLVINFLTNIILNGESRQ